jgi:hypothetical protein
LGDNRFTNGFGSEFAVIVEFFSSKLYAPTAKQLFILNVHVLEYRRECRSFASIAIALRSTSDIPVTTGQL